MCPTKDITTAHLSTCSTHVCSPLAQGALLDHRELTIVFSLRATQKDKTSPSETETSFPAGGCQRSFYPESLWALPDSHALKVEPKSSQKENPTQGRKQEHGSSFQLTPQTAASACLPATVIPPTAINTRAFLVPQMVKNLPAMQEISSVQSLSRV